MKTLAISSLAILLSIQANAQSTFTVTDIRQNSLCFEWDNHKNEDTWLSYGLTKQLELGNVDGLCITGLDDATFYYVQAHSSDPKHPGSSAVQLFSSASKSSGDITVYFNQTVDNTASSIADAIRVAAFEDTIVAYINRTQTTLDVCNYNTGSLPIVTAINNAQQRGVIVRYIAADNTGTNNSELANLSGSIPFIQRPNDGEVMHNKFLIMDVADPATAKILTGSTNHTNNSMHNDYNNMVIVEDQSLALAYKTEFEEMWGSTTNTPDPAQAKFGAAKTDNTPHSFSIGGIPVESYFSPSDGTTAKIEAAILTANTDMQFALLTYTNNTLGNAVTTIHNNGVNVKGIIENSAYFGSEYNGLLNAGVSVYSHMTTPNFFHHKYGIVDANNTSSDPLVITGSHNWTNSAENSYDENTLIIHDAVIANMYFEEFTQRFTDMGGSTGIQENSSVSIEIFPVPADKYVQVRASLPIDRLILYNAIGQVMYSINELETTSTEINIASLPKGMYYLTLYIKGEKTDRKIVVE